MLNLLEYDVSYFFQNNRGKDYKESQYTYRRNYKNISSQSQVCWKVRGQTISLCTKRGDWVMQAWNHCG